MMSNRNILGTTIKALGLSFMALVFGGMAWGQAPGVQWAKCYGGSGIDCALSICQTKDTGYIYGGYSNSNDGQVTGNHGGYDCWITKTDVYGNLQWEKSYGGSNDEYLEQIATDINGGYMYVAITYSNDSQVSGNHGNGDGWVVKLDDTGKILWSKTIGSSGYDYLDFIINTKDSGYLVGGGATANNGDVSGIIGASGFWVVKLTKTGSISWSKTYGGTNYNWGVAGIGTIDSGYLIAGNTEGGGYVSGFHSLNDAWLIKLNDTGALIWNKAYGGSGSDGAGSLFQKTTGEYIIGGYSNSNDGQVTGNHGGFDYWVFSVNDTGGLLWEQSYGGTGYDICNAISETYNNGVVLTGQAQNLNGDVSCTGHDSTGGADYWIVKINDTGNILWENTFGGSSGDSGFAITQTIDSGYATVGFTTSNNLDVSGNHGSEDYWVLKLFKDPPLKVETIQSDPAIKVYPTLTNGVVYVELPQGYEGANIVLIDVTGKKIQTRIAGQPNKRSVQISNLPEGMYFLDVVSHDRVSSFKVVYHP